MRRKEKKYKDGNESRGKTGGMKVEENGRNSENEGGRVSGDQIWKK